MRLGFFRLLISLLLSFPVLSIAATSYILHIQSPWTTDSLYVTGGFTGAYNVGDAGGYMTPEGDGWYVFTKTLNDGESIQSWWSFTIKSSAGTWGAGELNVASTFGTETEIWIYTSTADSTYYKISTMAPNSKVVWFKSPWGNHALPNMIHGSDTIRMRFVADDLNHCGWFFGAISKNAYATSSEVYFQQAYTINTLPASGSVDLASVLGSSDSAYVDGTSATLAASSTIGTTGTCFDSTRTIHVYHPWISTSYKDSLIYISVGNNLLNQPTVMDTAGEYAYWFKYDFSAAMAAKTEWSSTSALVEFYEKQNCWPACDWFGADSLRPTISEIFPTGIYEAWIFPKGSDKIDVSYAPIDPHYVWLLSPWDNSIPIMFMGEDTVAMRPVSNYCGWYQGIYYKYNNDWRALFRQRFGFEYYTAKGLDSIFENVLSLDSVFALSDTVWVRPVPMPSGNPSVSTVYPTGILGECPTRSISAMVFDWYSGEEDGGSPYYHPELDTGVNIDFGSAYNGTAKTEKIIDGVSYNGCQGLHLGMIEDTLSAKGLPLRNLTSFPEDSCTTADHLNGWFIPDTLVTKNGSAYTNTSCYDIPLALDDEGFWLADYIEVENDSSKIGFFPVDDFKFLDSNETVVNPLFDSINGGYRGWHNYSFSMKVQAQFVYVKGQYFEFRGDDDVWVFINGKLVVDIGGVHSPIEGFVNLDTLGLTEGDTYPFRIFFSERSASGSNFKMRTSIDLQTERSYYYQSSTTDEGLPEYKILQLIREEALSCDYTNGSATVKSAPSSFVLSGGGLASPVTLASGVNYGGITIADDYASFTIDTAAIVASRSLAPGTYTLTFSLASDASLSSKITFTINTYPLPTIAFADSLWNEIDPDTVTLGQYAFVPYQVNVIVYYMGVPCDTGCDELLNLSTLDSLIFQDAAGNSIDSVTLSSGRASFFVVGQGTIFAGAFDVFGSTVADTITWKNINLEKPPVPVPAGGKIFDVNGDGVADSLFLSYDSPITGDDAPDTLAWLFGDSLYHYLSKSDVAANLASDSIVVLTGDSLVSKLFTGSSENVAYSGSYKTTFYKVLTDTLTAAIDTVPFNVTGKIADKIGPVLVNAIVTPKSENVYQLSLIFSESIESNNIGFDSLFEFRVWRSGIESSSSLYPVSGSRSANRYEIYYSSRNGALPSVGDSVRFVPRSGVLDLSGNGPSENNRWVRIVGEQYIVVESTTLFSFSPENTAGVEKSAAIVPFKVPLESTLKEAEKDVGLPGFLVRYDLSELSLSSDTPKDKIYLAYDVSYFTNLGAYVNSSTGMVLCTDSVFKGDCTANPGNVYLAWNLRSDKGRLVATGAYIAKLDLKIGVIGGDRKKKNVSAVWGIRRNKE